MNRMFLLLGVSCFLFFSCNKNNEEAFTKRIEKVSNKTRKHIGYISSTDIGEKKTLIHSGANLELFFKKEETIKGGARVLEAETPLLNIGLRSTALYNLEDTMSYMRIYNESPTEKDSLFLKNQKSVWEGDSHHSVQIFTLTITNELLKAMEKDYTMLKKFPEYYKSK